MNCRHCNAKLEHEFIDLGKAPPSNNYISKDNYHSKEQTFPLRVMVCNHCWLVQTQDFSKAMNYLQMNMHISLLHQKASLHILKIMCLKSLAYLN